MKKITKNLMLIVTMFVMSIFSDAQITITEAAFNRPIGFTDSVWYAAETNINIPATGANQTWDFSGLTYSKSYYWDYFDATSDPNFANAINKENHLVGFQVFEFKLQEYESVDANGWFIMGYYVEDTTMTLQALTGSSADSIHLVGGVEPFQGRVDRVKFPTTYQDQWTQSRKETFQFELSVASLGLNKTPGKRVRTYTDNRVVTGYGDIIIPTQSGASSSIQVLQIQSFRTEVDSFFVGGQPASAILLNAFGVTQGATQLDSAMLFYTVGFGAPVFALNLNGNMANTLEWRPQADGQSTANINEFDMVQSNCFPNPAAKNGQINITADGFGDDTQFLLLDVMGRVVQEANPQRMGTEDYRIQLSALLPAGNYFYQLFDKQAKKRAHGKIIVK